MPDVDMDSNDEQEVEQIRISLQLAKGCPDTSLKVPSDPIAVPATTRKKGLSAIVNHLLGRQVVRDKSLSTDSGSDSDDDDSDDDEKLESLPFDFLINNKLLRLSIESAARKEGLSLETAVEIQYFPARLAPQSDGESEVLPDWISAMSYSPYVPYPTGGPDGNGDGVLYTASCDGSIRLFQNCDKGDDVGIGSFTQGGVIKAHSGPVKCISSLALGAGNSVVDVIASGSMDHTLVSHIHHRAKDKNGSSSSGSLALHAVYSGGHNSSINSVVLTSVNGCTTLISGDWDGGLCLWKVPPNDGSSLDEINVAPKRKKQKGSKETSTAAQVSEVSPTSFFRAHKSNISGIVWGHNNDDNNGQNSSSTLFTASWDHSIKAWDVESQNEILALNGSKVITSLGRCHNSDVVATSHPDCTVRLWDMRSSSNSNSGSGNVFDSTLRPSHKSWISSVEWSPNDPFVLASSSHDGSVKVWDIRSSLPLHTVRAHEKGQKSLCLAFANKTIFSGGTDCIVKKYRF